MNPPDDAEFQAFVRAAIDDTSVGPQQLQDLLRGRYPRAIVRRRDLVGERVQVWYVYRDGHWVRPFRP